MKTKNLTLALVILALVCSLSPRAGAGADPVNPDQLDLNQDVSQLGLEQVRTLEAALLARHCAQLMDADQRPDFQDYQDKKCGDRLYYEPYREFDPSVLTPAEKKYRGRLNQREAELKAGQVKINDGAPVYDRRAVANLSRFSNLPAPVMERLVRDGFVVVPAEHEQLFHVYEKNDYNIIPSFITVDSVLQLYHLYFDFTLRDLEEQKLIPALQSLTASMVDQLRARQKDMKDEDSKKAMRIALIYFAVAQDLLVEGETKPASNEDIDLDDYYSTPPEAPELISPADFKRPAPGWMDESMKKDFLAQRELILKAAEKSKGPLLGTVDYTMFRPRGHYTRSAALARFFRAMMWLGLPGFTLDGKTTPVETPLLIAFVMTGDAQLMKLYETIYEPTSFYVGPTDDVTLTLVRAAADKVCGPGATYQQWAEKKQEIVKEIAANDPARINNAFRDDRSLTQVRVMGMRYVPDSEILQRLTHWPERSFPTGLDIFAVMGAPAAEEALREQKIEWDGYWPEMAKLKIEFKDFKPKSGEPNLYWDWMGMLKLLNQPAPVGAAPFMNTKPWQYKNLNTSLASWTELRRDTILYAKQSGAECGGEEPIAPILKGYVEPRPEVFKAMKDLLDKTTSGLESRGLLTEKISATGAEIGEIFSFLERIADKEIKGVKVTEQEYESIRVFGSRLEYITANVLADSYEWFLVSGPDRQVAVIADVHTTSGTCLEEAVGLADELYALVVIDGHLYVTRGAVFSYYEFQHPASDRLTDEKWQKMLKDGQAPPRPDWTRHFMINQKVGQPSGKTTYSTGC